MRVLSDYRERKDIHFAVISFIFGVLFMVAVPPFQVPDEGNHFLRSYQISQGNFLSERRDKSCGGEVPVSLSIMANKIAGNHVAFHPENKQSITDILGAFHIPLERDIKKYAAFSNTAIYSPVPYIPQVTGIVLGKIFDAPPAVLFYLGRVFNLIFSVFLISYSIRIIPIFKNLMFLIALMPVSIHIFASLSPDAATISISFLLTSYILRLACDSEILFAEKQDVIFLMIASALLASCKAAYFPVVFLCFMIPVRKFGNVTHYILFGLAITVITLCCFFLWGAMAENLVVTHLYGGIPFGMAKLFIISHPVGYMEMVLRNLDIYLSFYIYSFIGVLGWLDTELPVYFIVIYGITMMVTALMEGKKEIRLSLTERIIIGIIAACCVLLIITSQYFIWTLETDTDIGMAQGRYFIPAAPLFFIPLLYNSRLSDIVSYKTMTEFTSFFVICSLIYTLFFVIQRYYL